MALGNYDVVINGIKHTVQLDEETAKLTGATKSDGGEVPVSVTPLDVQEPVFPTDPDVQASASAKGKARPGVPNKARTTTNDK